MMVIGAHQSFSLFLIFVLYIFYTSDARSHHIVDQKAVSLPQIGKKRAEAGTGTEAATGANTGAATASDSSSESQTFTNTKVNTRIATSSNARSGANAAAKVKTYAHANTETKVDTQQEKPTPPVPPVALTTPPPGVTPPGPEVPPGSNNNETVPPGECKEKEQKPPIIKVYCPNCPCPCPPPCPCKCPCIKVAPPPPPPPPCICLPPCPPLCPPPPPPCPPPCPEPIQVSPPCLTPCPVPPCPCNIAPITLDPSLPCPMDCPLPPCPCPFMKKDNVTKIKRSIIKKRRINNKRSHQVVTKRVNRRKIPNLAYAQPDLFKKAAVAADDKKCSEIGVEILKKGGSAADAVVSTHCCVEIVNSHSTGLGGGGFMVYYDKNSGKSKAYDFRETLPKEYTDSKNKTQGETILVPGVLRGLEAVWKDFGKLPWAELWKPCIKYAKEGFYIHEALAAGIVKKKDYIMANLGLRELFAPDGELLQLGSLFKRPKLARTYEQIAKHGADLFYRGEMAKKIVNEIKEAGGMMQPKDLSSYQVNVRETLKSNIGGLQLLTSPAPSSGSLLSLALKIMEQFKWKPEDLLNNPSLVYHQIIESMKFAYAPTSYLGDPRFTKGTDEVEQYMTSPEVAKEIFKRIDNKSHPVEYYKPWSELFSVEKTGTSHMSLVDHEGSAVSLTSSINAYFGSKLRSREFGFIYNNELADFSEFWPTIYNLTNDEKAPYKRPMSKVMPNIFLHGKTVKGVWGAAGGFFIPSALTLSIANWLFFKDNLKVAITRPRLHCQLFPPTVVYESTFPPTLLPKLSEFGHRYITNSTYDVSGQAKAIMGVVQAIVRLPNNSYAAESDYRKGGRPAGF